MASWFVEVCNMHSGGVLKVPSTHPDLLKDLQARGKRAELMV